ncbi:MAG: PrsW family glutamic-type intramembrane protease [Candidatus Paceibacterota bacterium]
MTATTLGYAFIGGLLPSFIWLYFLLKEDSRCPEPRTIIALAFVVGMVAVPLAIPLEQWAKVHLEGGMPVLTAWALIEEFLKYVMAAALILWRPAVDEKPDYVIYMITVALGFAAAENMLFLLAPISNGHIAASIFTGDIRFMGSTMLHVLASATIGFALAFSHDSHPATRIFAGAGGLILAIALHTLFNALIITEGTSTTLSAVLLVWITAVVFFAAFEVLKYFQYKNLSPNTCTP